ncbi:MAG TPA: hypothetical protein VJC39_00900 [Candidatus Nanoarchaeia archaeon]|nr:hypothetical protein [Candidatus Nanoarchaeia archaeon]
MSEHPVYGERTTVIYGDKDPHRSGITHLAIQTETTPPYIFATYSERRTEDLPKLGRDMLLISLDIAQRVFKFEKGNIADLVR